MTGTFLEWFWAHVEKTDECWEWKSEVSSKGYGRLRSRTRAGARYAAAIRAHRFSWLIHYGPIPAWVQVLHACDNRRCVRPDHLFVGTNADNVADKMSKGRQWVGRARSNVKLTEDMVRAIRQSTATRRELAETYGLTVGSIKNLRNGRTWRHVV